MTSILQIGCGPWGGNVLRDLLALGADVTVVARHQSSRDRARYGNATQVVSSISDVASRGFDGIVVATEITNHLEAVTNAGSFGLPIFVEKPLTNNVAHARRLLGSGMEIYLMDKWRYHPGIDQIKTILGSRILGQVIGITTVRNQWGSNHFDDLGPWTLLPHDISICEELIGGLGSLRSVAFDRTDRGVFGVEAIFDGPTWVRLSCHARSNYNERSVQVFCEQGTITLQGGYAESIQMRTNDGEVADVSIAGELPLVAELREFLSYLDGVGPAPRATLADACRQVETIENILSWEP